MHEVLQPSDWVQPKGYANGVSCTGRHIYIGGQVGWNGNQKFETDDFIGQLEQTLKNIKTILTEGGAKPEHMVRMTWYIKKKELYVTRLKEVGEAYRKIFGKNFPAMSCIFVNDLVEDRALVEIEVTAVVPA
jgi:enamine deaminase RidA (YjgF/YER057c/UK114 family)